MRAGRNALSWPLRFRGLGGTWRNWVSRRYWRPPVLRGPASWSRRGSPRPGLKRPRLVGFHAGRRGDQSVRAHAEGHNARPGDEPGDEMRVPLLAVGFFFMPVSTRNMRGLHLWAWPATFTSMTLRSVLSYTRSWHSEDSAKASSLAWSHASATLSTGGPPKCSRWPFSSITGQAVP